MQCKERLPCNLCPHTSKSFMTFVTACIAKTQCHTFGKVVGKPSSSIQKLSSLVWFSTHSLIFLSDPGSLVLETKFYIHQPSCSKTMGQRWNSKMKLVRQKMWNTGVW